MGVAHKHVSSRGTRHYHFRTCIVFKAIGARPDLRSIKTPERKLCVRNV
jgi:hypothetical protein